MTEFKDVKVGDMVTLKPMEVTSACNRGVYLTSPHNKGALLLVHPDQVDKVTSRPIQVGDKVRRKIDGPAVPPRTVLGIKDDCVWVTCRRFTVGEVGFLGSFERVED